VRTIGIATYTLKVRPKRSGDYEPLGGIDGRYSLAELLAGYLESISRAQAVDEKVQVVLQAVRRERDEDTLWGLLHSGEYGFAAEGFNIRSRRTTFRRTPEDAEVIPFYYRAFLPQVSDLGILLLQRYGGYGVFTAFSRGFKSFLDNYLPEHLLEINRLVPAEVVRHLTQGDIRAIQVVAHSLPTDITDKLRFLGNRQDIGTFVIEAKAKRNGALTAPPWLRRIREGRALMVELPTELDGSDATIRLRVDYEGKTRVIDLNDPNNLAPYVNATEDVLVESSGHPRFESINAYSANLLAELLHQLGRA
jgi:hypothetical protein